MFLANNLSSVFQGASEFFAKNDLTTFSAPGLLSWTEAVGKPWSKFQRKFLLLRKIIKYSNLIRLFRTFRAKLQLLKLSVQSFGVKKNMVWTSSGKTFHWNLFFTQLQKAKKLKIGLEWARAMKSLSSISSLDPKQGFWKLKAQRDWSLLVVKASVTTGRPFRML